MNSQRDNYTPVGQTYRNEQADAATAEPVHSWLPSVRKRRSNTPPNPQYLLVRSIYFSR
jgi:hypothetical protein